MEIFIVIMAIISGVLGGVNPSTAEETYPTEVVQTEVQSVVTFSEGNITAYVG